jgi:hypothetical protein
VRLLALSDDAAQTKAILGDDAAALAPILPYSVLLKNESTRKLRAFAVRFSYQSTEGTNPPRAQTRGLTLTLTAMNANDPDQISPGGFQLFTPVQVINQYLAESAEARRGKQFGQQPTTPSVSRYTTLTLAETIQQGLDRLMIVPGTRFEAFLEGVVFEDYSYVGSPRLREILVRKNSLIH